MERNTTRPAFENDPNKNVPCSSQIQRLNKVGPLILSSVLSVLSGCASSPGDANAPKRESEIPQPTAVRISQPPVEKPPQYADEKSDKDVTPQGEEDDDEYLNQVLERFRTRHRRNQ